MEARRRRRDRHARAPRRVRRAGRRVVARAREAGVDEDRHDRHRHRLVPRRARDRRARTTASSRRSASTRTRPATPEAGRVDELRELLAHPKAVAVGETGLDDVQRLRDAGGAAARSSTRSSRSPTSSTSRS